jgi:hypothetical protein
MVRSRPVQRFTIKEGSGIGARVWVVPDVFLLDSEEGSSPTSSSWEPKTGSTLVALRRARVRTSVTGLGDPIRDRFVHGMYQRLGG